MPCPKSEKEYHLLDLLTGEWFVNWRPIWDFSQASTLRETDSNERNLSDSDVTIRPHSRSKVCFPENVPSSAVLNFAQCCQGGTVR
jgi:hypothetical protein